MEISNDIRLDMTKLQVFVKSFVSSHRSIIFVFLPVLVLLLSVLFWDSIIGIPAHRSLWSLDGAPLYPDDYRAQTVRELTGHSWSSSMLGSPGTDRVFQPEDFLKLIFSPLVYHLLSWICGFMLITLATLYFLYSNGIKGLRAAIPALALGFSGYTFTLMSAGHRATPMTMGYAVLAMALVRNGIRGRTIVHFVLAALTCVYGIINQMDVMGFLLILIAAYGLMQLILAWPLYCPVRKGGDEKQRPRPKAWVKLLIALLLAATIFGVVGMPFYRALSDNVIGQRDEAIQKTDGNRWEFITNWSLPPEQLLELIAPSFYGRENTSQDCPYWGRLGQSMNWKESKQGFRNYRQHNLYVGAMQITFALYAFILLFRKGKGALSRERRIDIWFWWGVTVLTLLLAFGRYFPLYRIVYHIPMLNKIRCPVKWFHLTEISIVFLMSFGLHGMWQDLKDGNIRLPRRFCLGAAIIAGVLLIIAAVAQSTGLGMQTLWSAHGLTSVSPKLREAMGGALVHGACVFGALALVLWVVIRRCQSVVYRHCALAVLLVVLALDIAVAHKPFIHVRDLSAYYAPNPVADIVLAHKEPVRLADYLTSRGKHDPTWRNFVSKGVDMLMPGTYESPSQGLQNLFKALEKDPLRLWQVTSTRFIMGRRTQFAKLMEHPDIRLRASFYVTNKSLIAIDQSGEAPFVLLEYTKALPMVQLYHAWEYVADEAAALQRLADPSHDPTRTLLVVGDKLSVPKTSAAPDIVSIKSFGTYRYDVELRENATGILLFNENYDENRKVSVGMPLICNAGMQGVAVSNASGTLTTIYDFRSSSKFLKVHFFVIISLFGFQLIRVLRSKKRKHHA